MVKEKNKYVELLGSRIRNRRIGLDITQEELAKSLGYKSKSSINKIEIGENDLPQSKISLFASMLDTTPAYLMGWTNDPVDYVKELKKRKMEIPNNFYPEITNFERSKKWIEASENRFNDNLDKLYYESMFKPEDPTTEYLEKNNPELLDLYNSIQKNDNLVLLFDKTKDLSPEDMERILTVIKGIRAERGMD
ncbi:MULTISPECIES: helix-turn-helix transcriptional regulator [unclassified Breznakia]|uniref:helix-turn-helix domain-containing protein n=1 Tax=unclassified Breznakia TaxID=2623764 RepID=UPI0024736318|nr:MULTISPECIES: helix-turn-helix transcriptional regulator [unclassified Breznakia]MDH6367520.1 transcriptional regulator with XRE-family HTH domain [Breznakia sp. PH1-1]MDH6404686.1 transcriptional regulator with XRE-family HTH domain [Breznakia sp. PF1-11]MDH6412350.1 transcriptional regulator with XRE-family HTH domain [Breznakia sp. PFB1-11]MDH6414688.1 transcriptional regulator with XRE-family HTH domain [Breznakia sp. PFB1-14]MDH6417067.1 transcriptional regulator with XRE-family HTH do